MDPKFSSLSSALPTFAHFQDSIDTSLPTSKIEPPHSSFISEISSLVEDGVLAASWTKHASWQQEIRTAFDLFHSTLFKLVIKQEPINQHLIPFVHFIQHHSHPYHLLNFPNPSLSDSTIRSPVDYKSDVSAMTDYCSAGGHLRKEIMSQKDIDALAESLKRYTLASQYRSEISKGV